MAFSRKRAVAAATAIAVVAAVLSATPLVGSAPASAKEVPARHTTDLNVGPQHLTQPSSSTPTKKTVGLPAGVPSKGDYTFLVELKTQSAMTAYSKARSGGKSVADARKAETKQQAAIKDAQKQLISKLPAKSPVVYQLHNIVAGVAVRTDVSNYRTLAKMSNVSAVYPVSAKAPSNSYAVGLQNAPAVWGGSAKNLGTGVTVADIDTGFDYTHADFGGPGTAEAYDYAYAHDTEEPQDLSFNGAPLYDAAKYDATNSWDLVGDSYNAQDSSHNVPSPDPNPLDCSAANGGEGHGTHTAGSIAGFGVNADGSTYGVNADGTVDPDAYSSSTDLGALHIGPGMAPGATIVAYRVFGCTGTSNVVAQAIDDAMDPNHDGNTDDHADVINMSLGSDFGSPDDGDSITAGLAVDAGIEVVVASGNSNDVPDIGGSPGDNPKVLTVAASEDAQTISDGTYLTIDGADAGPYPTERSSSYPWGSSYAVHGGGDLSGTVVAAPADNATGCDTFSNADADAITGKIVFLKWTDDDLECGSVVRAANARTAGAIGFIFGSNQRAFSAGITGDSNNGWGAGGIPGVLVNSDGASAISAALTAGKAVAVTHTATNVSIQTFTEDNNKLADFSSRGIRQTNDVKPDVAAVGTTVFSALPGSGTDGQSMSGTSMATPMVAGLAALVIKAHPDWTPEQVKADIMNTADQNLYVGGSADPSSPRYAPNRVGSGRIDAASALNNQVLAYDGDSDAKGAVSAGFGSLEVSLADYSYSSPFTRSKTINVVNTGDTDETYTVTYDEINAMAGVQYKLSTNTLKVPAHTTRQVVVVLEIDDPSALEKDVDASYQHKISSGNGGGLFYDSASTDADGNPTGLPVETVAEASGNLLLTPIDTSASTLRLPVYASPRPVSVLKTQGTVQLDAGGKGKIEPWGPGINSGTDDESTWLESIGEGFELQYTSGAVPMCSEHISGSCVSLASDRAADLKYVGTTSDYPIYGDTGGSMEYFAITAQGAASSPLGRAEYDVYIDTDGDGMPNLVVYNTALGWSAQDPEPVYVAEVYDFDKGQVVDDEPIDGRLGNTDTAVYDSDTIVLPVSLSVLEDKGVTPKNPVVHYGMLSIADDGGNVIDSFGMNDVGDMRDALPVNVYQPAISVTETDGHTVSGPLVEDQDESYFDNYGLSLQVTQNKASYAADGGQGLMFVHFHNANGSKAQIVSLNRAAATTPKVALTAGTAKVGGKLSLGVQVSDPAGARVPAGTVKVTDASGATVASGTVDPTGVANLSYTPTKAGSLQLKAAFTPTDDYYTAATSNTVTVSVGKATPTVTLSAASSAKLGATVSTTVTVATVAGVVPTGKVTVKLGSTSVTGTLSKGKATVSVAAKKAGAQTLSATYAGDANYASASAKSKTVTVAKAAATVKVSAATSVKKGATLTATVTVATVGGVVPSGKVTVKLAGGTTATGTLSKGKVAVKVKATSTGKRALTVSYAGDSNFNKGSKSATVTVK
jgi:subtilisin family serine protease